MILDLIRTSNAKILRVIRGMVQQAEVQPLPQDWETRLGKFLSAFDTYPLTPL